MRQNRFFGWGSAPDPARGAYSPQTPYLYLRGLLLRGGRGRGREEGRGKEEGGERPYTPPVANSWLRHWIQVDRMIKYYILYLITLVIYNAK